MKNISLLFFLTIILYATQLHYEHNFRKSLLEAKKEHKLIMMMYSATWCPECNYMKDIVFKNKKIVQYINKHFIVLSFDIQKDKLPRGYEYDGIPTFFFINQNRKLIGKIIGGDKANRFLKKLKEIK